MHLLNFHFFIIFFKRLILYAHSDFTLVFLHISIKFVSYRKNFRLISFSTHEICWVSMAFCCNVEFLWLSSVLQPIALDQDPLVCINVSPPTCSKVLHSDAIPEYPFEHKCFPYLIRTSFLHFLSLQLYSGSVFLGCFVSSDH